MKYKKLSVLVVDDVTVVRQLLIKELNGVGVEKFHESSNINEAWEIITNNSVDIIFCDWNMPDGDGIDLLTKIRAQKDQRLKYMKFIMVTGGKEKAYQAMDAGSHNIIHKPFNQKDIISKLELLYN